MHRRRDGSIITAARAVVPADILYARSIRPPYMNGRDIYSPLTFTLRIYLISIESTPQASDINSKIY